MQAAVSSLAVPATMQAAVYTGNRAVAVQEIPVPRIGSGEILLRVHSCGICHTDLKKIEYDLLPAPRVFGHETAGEVMAVGADVTQVEPGDRVVAFHHIPCGECFYCSRKLYAQCEVYKRVGITAGYEPAGGGFAQFVRVMDWIVRRGVEKVPDDVSFDRASLVEPLNTCLKAVHQLELRRGETVLVQGQGPIGMMFTMLAKRAGCDVVVTDTMPNRLELGRRFGAGVAIDPREVDTAAECKRITQGRGVDVAISAVSAVGLVEEAVRATRPGAKILLFAQTSDKERIELSGKDICMGERVLMGSYSASVDLQAESARLVFSGEIPVEELISHRVPLSEVRRGIDLALHPDAKSLKIVVQPQRLL